MNLARGTAWEILRECRAVPGELNGARLPEGFYIQHKQVHLAPPVRLHHFVTRLAAPGGDPFLPVLALNPRVGGEPAAILGATRPSYVAGELPRLGGFPMEFSGTAVFRGDRLAGFLNVDETQMLLALRGEMGKAYVSIPAPAAPDQLVTLRFHQENLPQYRAAFRDGRPHVTVRLLLEGEVLAMPDGTDYSRPPARERLERAAGRYAERTLRSVLEKLQEWGADPAGFGHLFRGAFSTWAGWREFDWRQHAAELQVEVEVAVRIRRYGLLTGGDRVNGGR